MYFFPIFRFGVRVVRNIQKDFATIAKHLPLVWMGVIAINFFLMTFDVVKKGADKTTLPLIIFIVGLTITNIPFYILFLVALSTHFYADYLVGVYILYFISFIWMFLI